jgi:Cupin domain
MACIASDLLRGHPEYGSPDASWSPSARRGFSLRLRSENSDTSLVDGFVSANQTSFGTPYPRGVIRDGFDAGVKVGRHTHPGIESAYVLEGGFELPIQGQPTKTIKAGDAFQIPPETPHAGGAPGSAKSRILITYVVEKGKPLASPA